MNTENDISVAAGLHQWYFLKLKGIKTLKQISREQFDKLKEAKLLKYGNDKNFQITSRKKKSNRKKYYIVEDSKILIFLEMLEKGDN